MSWCEGMCDCGEMVSYGFYSSEYEDELAEINITVLCGQCVRERDGIPSKEESDNRYEDFKNMVLENGIEASINFDEVNESLTELLHSVDSYFNENKDERYIQCAYSILKTMPQSAIQW